MRFFRLSVWLGFLVATLIVSAEVRAQANLISGLGGPSGYGSMALNNGDDSPSTEVSMSGGFPHGFSFFGRTYHSVWININGNITFGSPYAVYTPDVFPASPYPMIAPWWSDVDLRGSGAHNTIYHAVDYPTGRWIVTWIDVGYYSYHVDKLNSFQMVLTDRTDIAPGDFDVEVSLQPLPMDDRRHHR